MRILAVDPGTEQSAFVEWDGRIIHHGILPNLTLVNELRDAAVENDVLVLEKFESYGMAVGREVFETVFWSGRFAEAWFGCGGRFEQMPRREVKLHLCGQSRATDSNIRTALIDRFGPVGTKKNQGPLWGMKGHLFAALAVAVTYYDTHSGEIRPGVTAQF